MPVHTHKHIWELRLCEQTMQMRSTNGAQILQSGHKFCWHSNGHFDWLAEVEKRKGCGEMEVGERVNEK